MPDKPAFKSETITREQLFKACEALGIDENQTRSIHITADKVEVEFFEFNENGERFFTDPDGKNGYAKYTATIKVT